MRDETDSAASDPLVDNQDLSERDDDEKNFVERLADKARGSGVGTEDPNIIGDAGPTDVPPGKDPDAAWPPEDPVPA